MKITIGYLYYDLMNLYGDIGNIKVLKYHLEKQGIKTEIKKLTLEDKIDFESLDVIYIGSGTEKNRDIVLKNILKYKKEINTFIKNNKYILVTGNSYPLFGKSIINSNNESIDALNIFEYHEIKTNRVVEDVVTKTDLINQNIFGFYNHYNEVIGISDFLFEKEGCHYNNFYGTYLIGPLLARNPKFLIFFIKQIINNKQKKYNLKKFNVELEEKAYSEYIIFKKTKKEIK